MVFCLMPFFLVQPVAAVSTSCDILTAKLNELRINLECALEDLTDAQKAALSAMAAAFNESCVNQATVLLGWTHR